MAFVAKAVGLLQDNRSKLNNNGLNLTLVKRTKLYRYRGLYSWMGLVIDYFKIFILIIKDGIWFSENVQLRQRKRFAG